MKIARRAVDGVLLLDKPVDLSSNSAVGWAKRLFNAEKAGHTGTLDPFATGLLPICFGQAAKFSRFMLDAEKGYRATLRLGQVSSTGDTEGEIIERRQVIVDLDRINAVLVMFVGARTQIPPMHSALKRDGVPLYKLARQGIEIEREPRDIVVHRLDLVSLHGDELIIDVLVSKGTYIRVLAQDIGAVLGCGAHLAALRRTSTGGYDLAQAMTFEALDALPLAERDRVLLAPDSLAQALPKVTIPPAVAKALCNGQIPHVASKLIEDCEYCVYAESGAFLGVAKATQTDDSSASLTAVRLMGTHAEALENA